MCYKVCFVCEERARDAGRCPYRKSCQPGNFCLHAGRCIACEGWSCDDCRLLRGDGEDVSLQYIDHVCGQLCTLCLGVSLLIAPYASLAHQVLSAVERLEPSVIFLDFDRTLASTKSGGEPVVGKHTVDTQLLSLCLQHPNVHVVTRNSHQEAIVTFLEAAGLPHSGVHHVAKKVGSFPWAGLPELVLSSISVNLLGLHLGEQGYSRVRPRPETVGLSCPFCG